MNFLHARFRPLVAIAESSFNTLTVRAFNQQLAAMAKAYKAKTIDVYDATRVGDLVLMPTHGTGITSWLSRQCETLQFAWNKWVKRFVKTPLDTLKKQGSEQKEKFLQKIAQRSASNGRPSTSDRDDYYDDGILLADNHHHSSDLYTNDSTHDGHDHGGDGFDDGGDDGGFD